MENAVAAITPSPVRRVVAVSILWALGLTVIYLGFSRPPAVFMWQVFLIILGAVALAVGDKLRRATALSLYMTDTVLCDSTGHELCRLDDITGIDRGAFAFKPANGFLLRTSSRQARNWSPGLWWRVGRRIGVGGATSAQQGKFMAEAIALRVASRESD
ncbi:MAG: hypothetical protein V3U96_09465 [Paracoccaceae bacterium]